jgi:geranylgeranylglycerol-phosphate geranylgeranyltransferase
VVGLVSAGFLGIYTLGIAAIFALIGWFYNYRGKKFGLGGNSLVALSLAIPYIFGSISVGVYGVNLAYLLGLTSFLAGLGREVLKGISDVAGDKVRGIKSVAISSGIERAKQVTAILFLLAVASSALPILANLLGHAWLVYAALILIPDAIFCYLAAKTLVISQQAESLKLKKIALLGMLLGLLSYLIAGVLV